jgi:ABC-type transporter Mla subunit MlaD
MSLQDLTPQLRTRLNRMERAVGWFVFIAAMLLLFGFGYYIYHTAENKGWFKVKARFRTYLQSSAGLKEGDGVYMMGRQVGTITRIHVMEPDDVHKVEVAFEVAEPNFRYIRSRGSVVKVNSSLLGASQLEVTRGKAHSFAVAVTQPTYYKTIEELRQLVEVETNQWQLLQFVTEAQSTNVLFRPYQPYTGLVASNLDLLASLHLESNAVYVLNNKVNERQVVAVWDETVKHYKSYDNAKDAPIELPAEEAIPVAERLDQIVGQVQAALPGILALTNKIAVILDNTTQLTSNLNATVVSAQPLVTNLAALGGELRGPGALGTWVLGANAPFQISTTLTNVNTLLVNTDTNLDQLTEQIGLTLINVADITSNLNCQVRANSNFLGGVSKTIMDTDDLVQGLKRHWLLRSAFKASKTSKTNAVAPAKK